MLFISHQSTHFVPSLIESGLTTIQLIVVLACVAGVTCMCLGFFMLCYRRRSPRQLQKVHKRKSWFSRVLPPVLNRSKSSEHQSSGEDIPRLISFGNMPSYRSDNEFTELSGFNSLRAKFLRGKINIYMYLHFMSLLHIDMTQVLKILLQVRPGPTYSTESISWLLMPWRRKEPGHQQPWYWPS